jgi:hypothetical protein
MTWTKQTNTVLHYLALVASVIFAIWYVYESLDGKEGANDLFLTPIVAGLMYGIVRIVGSTLVFPIIGFGVGFFRTSRRALRSAQTATRTYGSNALDVAIQALGECGLPTQLPGTALREYDWSRRASMRRVRPWMSAAAFISVMFAVAGLAYWLLGTQGAFWIGILGGPVVATIAAMNVAEVDLGTEARVQATYALQVKSQPLEGRLPAFWLGLPSGGAVRWQHTSRRNERFVVLSQACPSVGFDASLVSHDRLELEIIDLDTGDRGFDRATLIQPHAADESTALLSAWLTPGVRAVLLQLLAMGGTLEKGDFSMRVDLASADALSRLDAVLTLMNGLHALWHKLAALSPLERGLNALNVAETAQERGELLSEANGLSSDIGMQVLREWAVVGSDETRLTAISHLSPSEQISALVSMAGTTEIESRLRGLALAALSNHSGERAIEVLEAALRTGDVPLILGAAEGAPKQLALVLNISVVRDLLAVFDALPAEDASRVGPALTWLISPTKIEPQVVLPLLRSAAATQENVRALRGLQNCGIPPLAAEAGATLKRLLDRGKGLITVAATEAGAVALADTGGDE